MTDSPSLSSGHAGVRARTSQVPPDDFDPEPKGAGARILIAIFVGAPFLALLAAGWLFYEFSRQSAILAISNLNTYNFLFVMAGLLLHWRPKRFLAAVAKSVPATAEPLLVA